jgi:hypothetical protein
MDISARAFSLADRPQRAIRVTSVRMRREDRSSISTYFSRRPRLETVDSDYVIACSSFRPVPLFEPRAVPSSRPAERRSRRAQGAVKAGRRAWLAAGSGVARPRLDGPRARREDQAGWTSASSVLVSSKARPFASTAQAMRASLLASAITSTLWCNRLLAASIQDLSP